MIDSVMNKEKNILSVIAIGVSCFEKQGYVSFPIFCLYPQREVRRDVFPFVLAWFYMEQAGLCGSIIV